MVVAMLLIASAAVAVIAIKRHGSMSAALASAKREAVLIENAAAKLEASAKAEILTIVARIKSL